MPRSRDFTSGLSLQSWKPFNKTSCLTECPPGYEEVSTESNNYGKVYKCEKCLGKINFSLLSQKVANFKCYCRTMS